MIRSVGGWGVVVVALLAQIPALSGCVVSRIRDAYIPVPSTIDEVGSVRVSAVSVARWSDYVDVLQPQFKLDAEKALEKVVPTTRAETSRAISDVGFDLRLAAPVDTRSVSSTASTADGTTSKQSTVTETKAAGDLAGVDSASATVAVPGADAAASLFGDVASVLATVDPRLQYQAATALFQEVQVLNRYVRDAVTRTDYEPYVVRLQVTLMPRRRNLPFDAYVNLSFFVDPVRHDGPHATCANPIVVPLLATDSLEASLADAQDRRIRQIGLAAQVLAQTAAGVSFKNLSDELEGLLGRNVNSTFTIGRLSDNTVRARLGALQQVNSEYAMVPRTEAVTLLVLVPAAVVRQEAAGSDASGGCADGGRSGRLQIRTFNEMIDARNGRSLAQKPLQLESDDVADLVETYGLSGESIERAWEDMVLNDWQAFLAETERFCEECVKPKAAGRPDAAGATKGGADGGSQAVQGTTVPGKETREAVCLSNDSNAVCEYVSVGTSGDGQQRALQYRFPEDLWLDLASLMPTYRNDMLGLELPAYRAPYLFPDQTPLLIDTGDKSVALLNYGEGLTESRLCGELRLHNAKNAGLVDHRVPVESFALKDGGRYGEVKLASLKAMGLGEYASKGRARFALNQAESVAECRASLTEFVHAVAYRDQKEEPVFGYKQSATLGYVTADAAGTGRLDLVLAPDGTVPATKVDVQITGALVKEVVVNGLTVEPGTNFSISLLADGKPVKERKLVVRLEGLLVGKKVIVQTKNEKGGKREPLELEIVPPIPGAAKQ